MHKTNTWEKLKKHLALLFLLSGILFPDYIYTQEGLDIVDEESFVEGMTLEELMDVEVTSVSKRSETLLDASAAVTVINNEDIRRSGATTIMDTLRIVPGMQVARIDANKWAISSRGFNDRYANKLLVLVDGREVYSSIFAGTYWESLDTLLEDIDRIEVIRGPGATLWGANAVNGVINIITKRSRDTQGFYSEVGGGSFERAFSNIRYGSRIGDDAYYRVYGKVFERDSFEPGPEGSGHDDSRGYQLGFRTDWEPNSSHDFTLQGDFYEHSYGSELLTPEFGIIPAGGAPGFQSSANNRTRYDDVYAYGFNILGRWCYSPEDDSKLSLQTYFMRAHRDDLMGNPNTDTFEVSFQHNLQPWDNNNFVYGIAYRLNVSAFDDPGTISAGSPTGASKTENLISLFLQDTAEIFEDRFFLTLGSKFEHNDYSGFEFQPSGRATLKINDRNSIWGAASWAVRTPSRYDTDLNGIVDATSVPNGSRSTPTPGVALTNQLGFLDTFTGSTDFDSEDLLAFELGYRTAPLDNLSFDIAGFYNQYSNLRSYEVTTTEDYPNTTILTVIGNRSKAETYGVEFTTTYNPTDFWELTANYSWIEMQIHQTESYSDSISELDEHRTPHHQVGLISKFDLPFNIEFDQYLYWVDQISGINILGLQAVEQPIDSYFKLDLRASWHATEHIELSIVGQNLIEQQHEEFASTFINERATQVPRSVYGSIKIRY